MHVLTAYGVCKDQRHAPAGNNAYAANYHVNKEFMRHDKLERELYLLQLLTENRTYTIERLCEKLGISRRNLYYYLEFFRDSGFKVYKHGNCYSIDRNSPFFNRLIERISITEEEAVMISACWTRQGWLEHCEWDIKFPTTAERHEFQVLTINEQRKLMTFLKSHFSFKNLGLYICLCTGLRIGEICALKWSDISVKTQTICIRRTIERVYVIEDGHKYTKLIISTPKSASSIRDIPISGDLLRLLKPIIGLVNSTYFVLTNTEKPLEPRIYRHYYKRFMSKLNLPAMKFHGLRHTFATRCIESNCDYKTVSSILGHSSVSTTLNLYVHPDMGQKRKCIDKMLKSVR